MQQVWPYAVEAAVGSATHSTGLAWSRNIQTKGTSSCVHKVQIVLFLTMKIMMREGTDQRVEDTDSIAEQYLTGHPLAAAWSI